MHLDQWLRSVHIRNRHLTGYKVKLSVAYTDLVMVVDLHVSLDCEANVHIDDVFFKETGVTKPGETLFNKWFQDRDNLPEA